MNYGVATADGGMLAHKGETMNERERINTEPLIGDTISDAALTAIEADPSKRDVPTLIAALRASRKRIAIMQTALDSHCETIKALAAERDAALAARLELNNRCLAAEERARVLKAHHATEHRRCESWTNVALGLPPKDAKAAAEGGE